MQTLKRKLEQVGVILPEAWWSPLRLKRSKKGCSCYRSTILFFRRRRSILGRLWSSLRASGLTSAKRYSIYQRSFSSRSSQWVSSRPLIKLALCRSEIKWRGMRHSWTTIQRSSRRSMESLWTRGLSFRTSSNNNSCKVTVSITLQAWAASLWITHLKKKSIPCNSKCRGDTICNNSSNSSRIKIIKVVQCRFRI